MTKIKLGGKVYYTDASIGDTFIWVMIKTHELANKFSEQSGKQEHAACIVETFNGGVKI